MTPKVFKLSSIIDFDVLGIVSAAPAYKLCHFINQETTLNLMRDKDLELDLEGLSEPSFFSYFEYCPPETEYYFTLVQNKGSNAYLVPEKKELDYLLIIRDDYPEKIPNQIKTELGKVDLIQAIFLLPVEKLKSKENLIF